MRNRVIAAFEICFAIILGFKLIERLLVGYFKECWQVTEWLINYQGGFVRRGLPGELLLGFYHRMGVSPYYTILAICFLLYIALVFFFYSRFHRAGLPVFVLPFVFFLGGPLFINNWVRKDVLLLWFFIGMVRLAVSGSRWSIAGINLLLVCALLTHESIGFWAIPVLFILLYRPHVVRGVVRGGAMVLLQLFPALAAFLLVLYNKGSVKIATAIWDSWKPIPFPFQDNSQVAPPAAIDGVSWSLGKGLRLSGELLSNFNDGVYAPIAWLVIAMAVFSVSVNVHKFNRLGNYAFDSMHEDRPRLCAIMLLQFIAVSPLFVLGIDYGRWIFFWVTTSFVLYLVVPPITMQKAFSNRWRDWSAKVLAAVDGITGGQKGVLYVVALFIGMPNSVWTMESYYHSTPLYLTLQFASNIVLNARDYLGFN